MTVTFSDHWEIDEIFTLTFSDREVSRKVTQIFHNVKKPIHVYF